MSEIAILEGFEAVIGNPAFGNTEEEQIANMSQGQLQASRNSATASKSQGKEAFKKLVYASNHKDHESSIIAIQHNVAYYMTVVQNAELSCHTEALYRMTDVMRLGLRAKQYSHPDSVKDINIMIYGIYEQAQQNISNVQVLQKRWNKENLLAAQIYYRQLINTNTVNETILRKALEVELALEQLNNVEVSGFGELVLDCMGEIQYDYESNYLRHTNNLSGEGFDWQEYAEMFQDEEDDGSNNKQAIIDLISEGTKQKKSGGGSWWKKATGWASSFVKDVDVARKVQGWAKDKLKLITTYAGKIPGVCTLADSPWIKKGSTAIAQAIGTYYCGEWCGKGAKKLQSENSSDFGDSLCGKKQTGSKQLSVEAKKIPQTATTTLMEKVILPKFEYYDQSLKATNDKLEEVIASVTKQNLLVQQQMQDMNVQLQMFMLESQQQNKMMMYAIGGVGVLALGGILYGVLKK